MVKVIKRIALMLMVVIGFPIWVAATGPSTIRVEAKITDPVTGAPNGAYAVRFRLYPDGTATSNVLWEENQNSVVFVQGVFTATLGSTTPFKQSDFNYSNLVLGIQVDAASEVQIPVSSVPSAMKSTWADYVGNFNWASVNVTNTPNVSAFSGLIIATQIPDSIVTSRMISTGAILDSHITGPISISKLSGSMTSLNIGSNSITAASISDGAISNSKLSLGTYSNIIGVGALISTLNAQSGAVIGGTVVLSNLQAAPTNRSMVTIVNNQLVTTDTSGWDTVATDDVTTFKQLTDVNVSSYNSVVGQVVAVNSAGNGLSFVDTSAWDKSATDDVTTFSKLTDVSVTSYNNVSGYYLQVNSGGTGITFINPLTTGVSNASSLSGVSATQFLRADTSGIFSSGQLAMGSGTTLNIDSGAILNVSGGLVLGGTPVGALAKLSQVAAAQIQNLVISDYHISPTASISWTKILKSGSSFADIQTRSASDINGGQLGADYYDAYQNLTRFERIATSSSGASTLLIQKGYADSAYLRGDASATYGGSGQTLSIGGTSGLNLASGSTLTISSGATLTVNGSLTVGGISGVTGNFTGTVTANSFVGDGSAVTALNATNLSSGTVASARLTGDYTGITGLGAQTSELVITGKGISAVTGNFSGAVTGTSFTGALVGDGSAVTALNATNLSSGTVASARLTGDYTGITGLMR